MSISSTPWLETISNAGIERSRTSTSTRRWSSLPSRSCARSFSRVRSLWSRRWRFDLRGGRTGELSDSGGGGGEAGSSRSSTRSSAACSARSATSSSFSSRTMSMDGLDQIAHHGFDVAADVAHFGVLRGFHLDERAPGQPREPPRNFRFSHSGRPDHQNIFRQDVLGHLGRELLPAHAVAQRDGDRALRRGLPDDVLVQLDDDFARRQLVERRLDRGFRFALVAGKIDHHGLRSTFRVAPASRRRFAVPITQIQILRDWVYVAPAFRRALARFQDARPPRRTGATTLRS